jgi:metal-responsive CopG/Arc/MetJ family transcriptional regulator
MLLFPNIIYNINVNNNNNVDEQNNNNGTLILTYQHRSYSISSFTIKLKQTVASIIVAKVSYKQNS